MRKRRNCRCCSKGKSFDGFALVLGITLVWIPLALCLSSSAVLAAFSNPSYKSPCLRDIGSAPPALSDGTLPVPTEAGSSIPSIAWLPGLSCWRCCTLLLPFACSTGRRSSKRWRLLSLGLVTSSGDLFS